MNVTAKEEGNWNICFVIIVGGYTTPLLATDHHLLSYMYFEFQQNQCKTDKVILGKSDTILSAKH